MKILVTGGAGYVGSHCVRLLRDEGHQVVVYDNLRTGHRLALSDDVPLFRGDMLDRQRLTALFEAHSFDSVVHCAAMLDVTESVSQPRLYYENNVLGTLNLVGIMMSRGLKRLVFSSTGAIYGIPDELPVREDAPRHPITPYGRTKLVVEMALHDYAQANGLGSIALRYFNAAGAAHDGAIGEDHQPESHLVPLALQVALGQREQLTLFGTDYDTPDGTAVRDYVHVEDLASAHLLALGHIVEGEAEVFNVGTGRGTSVREVVDSARRITGHPIPTLDQPRRPGDAPALIADTTRIRQALGWSAATPDIDDIVASAWRWHRANPNGFDE